MFNVFSDMKGNTSFKCTIIIATLVTPQHNDNQEIEEIVKVGETHVQAENNF